MTTERYHRGWRATVDGQELSPVRVYGDDLGCVVEPGAHQVVFRFAPASFRNGLWMSGLGLLLTILVSTAVGWRRNPMAR